MCCCFSFSFSKHTLDDVCLSLVFKSVLNSVTFDNCGRFWKCAKQKIMYGSSSSHTKRKHVLQALTTGHIGISWMQTEKKFPWHWVQSEAAVFHWQWLTGLVWKDVVLCVWGFFWGGGLEGGGGGVLINCPKVLMWSACSESCSFNLSYHTVTVPRFTTAVYCLFSLGEIVFS